MTSDPGTAIERRQQIKAVSILSDDEIRRLWRLSEALASSGMFPDAESAAQAFAKILVGTDLGLTPTQSLMGVHLVEGKPQIAATLLAGFVKRTPGYDYEVIDHDETKCQIAFFVDDGEPKISSFTIEEATQAGLVKDKSAWKKYPRNMLFARAMSNGVKWYMPDAAGGVAIYTEGDALGADVPQLTAGTGSGEAQGLDLGPRVEKVLARAAELGHEAIADRATAEMTLGQRGPEVAVEWAKVKEAELDAYEAAQPPEADVVEPDDATNEERAHAAREAAEALEREAEKLEAEGIDADPHVPIEGVRAKTREMREGAEQMRLQAEAFEAEGGGA